MNWYKRYIFAGLPAYTQNELLYKLKLFGVEFLKEGKGDHSVFQNKHNGMISAIPMGPGSRIINPVTMKRKCVEDFGIPWPAWAKTPKKPTAKDMEKIQHLLPWGEDPARHNVDLGEPTGIDVKKPYENEPWYIEQKKREEEVRKRKEEEERWLEEEIRRKELAKLNPAFGSNNMNWYKEAQKMPTMDDIVWAIDKLIAENYDFSVEELQQAFLENNYNKSISKAAQTATLTKKVPLPYWVDEDDEAVMELFELGYTNGDISKKLGISGKEISKILKKYFSSKDEQEEYLYKKHDQNIVDAYQNEEYEMEQDFNVNVFGVSFEKIANILGISSKYVSKTLKYNGLSLDKLSTDRKNRIGAAIAEIANDLGGVFQIRDVQREFYKRHNFKLKDRSAFSAIKLLNLGDKAQNDETTILKAFTIYINNHQQGGVKALEFLPDKIPVLIDGFFIEYGQNHGFPPPIQKEQLKNLLMTKIQLRERTEQNAINRNNPDRYAPIATDETHPSYFLNNQNQYQEASNKMNWYKKANKWKNKIDGGRADDKKPSDYNKRSVEKGKKIEYEHTNEPGLAREIAIDHLEEHPDYYNEEKGLPAMEKKLEKKKPARRGRYNGGLQRVNL